ncbi:hypothetical protein VX159_10565 [Dechloromonas sp. ZY10]|uniref:hypothetical protein n=1 Tax=Dechloromonas aquae TaxID=2664436 RepID=UPI0035295303
MDSSHVAFKKQIDEAGASVAAMGPEHQLFIERVSLTLLLQSRFSSLFRLVCLSDRPEEHE